MWLAALKEHAREQTQGSFSIFSHRECEERVPQHLITATYMILKTNTGPLFYDTELQG